MRRIKLIASSSLLIFAVTFSSCQKSEHNSTTNTTDQIFLSEDILKYDIYIKNRVVPYEWTVADTKSLLLVASADLGSAWEAFKFVSSIAGPGYGGAAAMIAGIGGSIYTWWLNSPSSAIAPSNPNTNVTFPYNNPLIIGELHNSNIHIMLSNGSRYKSTTPSTVADKSYEFLISRASVALKLPASEIKKDITKAEYISVLSSRLYNYTGEHNTAYVNNVYDEAINEGYPTAFARYYREFLSRAGNIETFSYEDALAYCDMFTTNVNNQQALSQYEKHYMKSIISIYKNSLKYWKYTLD